MQAIVQDTYGSADVLRLARIARPEVGDSEVLIRVHAASVHIGDWHVMTGLPYLLRVVGFGFRAPKARVRGMDVAGTVEAVGQNVTQFELGDEVFGTCAGSFAEQANARVDTLARKPEISASSRRRPYPPLLSQLCRLFAMRVTFSQAIRS
jgi:NADPH:quinone reductase-like Zn-dependent oxidoreductase